ncbi:unnamed protein product [Rhizoctonia solani]|uniref:Nephrocystin 3-like N-terminal domain-containing protein n=1 Tax=Rhizoctonia solani TaxID=456999 RepID=A0A8H3D1V5_9AGAM|nr:unnamed protein product [Rhizoctonia solani]
MVDSDTQEPPKKRLRLSWAEGIKTPSSGPNESNGSPRTPGPQEAIGPIMKAPWDTPSAPGHYSPGVNSTEVTPELIPDKKLKSGSRVRKVTGTGLKTLWGALESSADAFGPLKSAIGGLNRCVEIFESASKARDDYRELGEKLDQTLGDLSQFVDDPISPRTMSVKNLCNGIQAELKVVEEKQGRKMPGRYAEAMQGSDDILECYQRIHGHVERLRLNANMNIWKTVDEEVTERHLRHLSPTLSGAYNSGIADKTQRRQCEIGTRRGELQRLRDWARDQSAGAIYWMNGMAGTGKTTISYSLCDELSATGELAASFFCTRLIPECRDVQLIIPSIAYQLARFSYPFRYALSKALECDPDAHTRELKLQLQKLIATPLQEVQHALPTGFVVVIDALDECEDKENTGKILDLLVLSTPNLPIRFLISSRPEPEIYQRMTKQLGSNSNLQLILHELDPVDVKADIQTYLRHELHEIPLTTEQWKGLVERCGVLFLYASTACRYIKGGDEMMDYKEAVDTVLGLSSEWSGDMEKELDTLYRSILEAAFKRPRISEANRKRMKTVLDTVICAHEPMTVEAMAGLLDLKNGKQVDALLRPICSVVHVADGTGVATTLHASFPEFMLNRDRSSSFYCDPTTHHHKLTRASLLQIKLNPVQFNICRFESSYLLDNQVTNLTQRVERAVSPTLLYACQYWVAHLELSGRWVDLVELVHDFLSARLLLWMEVLNTGKCIASGIELMQRVKKWTQNMPNSNQFPEFRGVVTSKEFTKSIEELTELANDAWQFVSVYANHPVSESTPHIYLSMLPFWPISNPISKHYTTRTVGIPLPHGITISQRPLPLLATWSLTQGRISSICYTSNGAQIATAAGKDIYVLDSWTGATILGPMEGHAKSISSIAISPNGLYIASGSSDSTARMWDTRSGKAIVTLGPFGYRPVVLVAFSPDSTRVVTAIGGEIRIWAVPSGEPIISIKDIRLSVVRTALFSSDGSQIITGAWDIMFWDVSTGKLVNLLRGHDSNVLSLAISPDRPQITSASEDSTIRVWDIETGNIVLGPLRGHVGPVNRAVFSPNGLYIASCGDDYTIRIWDAQTGEMVTNPLEGHTGAVKSIAFSPDSSRLISCSFDDTVRIWNTQQIDGASALLEGHTDWVRSARFSSDGSQLVTGGEDCCIYVWDTHTGDRVVGPLKGHTQFVYSVDISPDKSCIASASRDRCIWLWDLEEGTDECLDNSTMRGEPVNFLSGGSQLAFGSDEERMQVWDLERSESVAGDPQDANQESFDTTGGDLVHLMSLDGDCRDFDMPPDQEIAEVFDISVFPYDAIYSTRTLPNHSVIYFGSKDKEKRMYNPRRGHTVRDALTGHVEGLFSIVTSPDGLHVASANEDGAIQMWDAQTGQLVMGPLEGHTDPVTRILFSPDGTRMVSLSFDLTMRFWPIPEKPKTTDGHSEDSQQQNNATIDVNSRWKLNRAGWIVNSQGGALVWVPPDLRPYLLRPENDLLISKRGSWKLEFAGTNIGPSWVECYRPV